MLAVKVFAEDVARRIQDFLPLEYQNATYTVKEQNKTNGVLQVGIQVDMPGRCTSPIVYMESFYDEIRKGNLTDKIMGIIATTIQRAMENPVLDESFDLTDFDKMKGYLAVMAINAAENRKLLENVPHKDVEDLSAICYVDLPAEQTEYNAIIKVTNQMLKEWGVSREEVFSIASENTRPANRPTLQRLEDVVKKLAADGEEPENLLLRNVESCGGQDMVLILSNAKRNFGAAMMLETKVMDQISQVFPKGFYILPSSVHEVLIAPIARWCSPRELGEMVREVNQTQVDKTERLSDRVYTYDKEKRQICQVQESIERGKEMLR